MANLTKQKQTRYQVKGTATVSVWMYIHADSVLPMRSIKRTPGSTRNRPNTTQTANLNMTPLWRQCRDDQRVTHLKSE